MLSSVSNQLMTKLFTNVWESRLKQDILFIPIAIDNLIL